MLRALEPWRTPTPHWLLSLTPADIACGPEPWWPLILENATVYPGSSTEDGSPVRQLVGVTHSFIFPDYGITPEQMLGELYQPCPTGVGFAHHTPVGWCFFDATALLAQAPAAFTIPQEAWPDAPRPRGVWAVFETQGPGPRERFSFLFLQADGVQTLAALFPERPPRALVVQEHGLGGMRHWSNYSSPLLELGKRWDDTPEFLILGPNHRLHPWCVWGHRLTRDYCGESWHHNLREVFHMHPKARRLAMRGLNFRRHPDAHRALPDPFPF